MRRMLQRIGVAVVLVTACLPTFTMSWFPSQGETPFLATVGSHETPVAVLGAALSRVISGTAQACPFWEARRWYPWYLALLWALALAAVWRRDTSMRRRTLVGGGLWLVTLLLLGFEAAYLRAEYLPFLGGLAGRIETVGAWVFVASILLYRRRGARRPAAVEATIASQALLGFVHALTLPATMARGWVGVYAPGSIAQAVWQNFPIAFWLGCAGLLLAAVPIYLGRTPPGLPSSDPPS